MNGKKIRLLVLGSISILAGALLGAGSIRAARYELQCGIFGGWEIADAILRILLTVYFVWIGVRAIRRVDGDVAPTKIGWGRMLFGITLIYGNIRGHFVPNPNTLRPDGSQSAVTQLVRGIIYFAGVALIVGAFKEKQKPAELLPEQSNSAAGQT